MNIRNLPERLSPGLRRLVRAASRDLWHVVAGPDQPLPLLSARWRVRATWGLAVAAPLVFFVLLFQVPTWRTADPRVAAVAAVTGMLLVLVALHRPLLAWRIAWLALLYEVIANGNWYITTHRDRAGRLIIDRPDWQDWLPELFTTEFPLAAFLIVLFTAAASHRRPVVVWIWLLTAGLLWTAPLSWAATVTSTVSSPTHYVWMTTSRSALYGSVEEFLRSVGVLYVTGPPEPFPVQVGGVVLATALVLAGLWAQAAFRTRQELAQAQGHGSVLAERARIARELHDVIAHHMSMIAVRAETAPYRLSDVDGAARDEFLAISQDSRTALNEMRRLLGVLRNGEAPLTAPQPSLADLTDLLEMGRRAGATVTLDAHGELTGLPVAVDVCAYRIVQEALSNASQHAPGAPIQVMLRRTGHALALSVRNEPVTGQPPAPAPPPTGHAGQGVRGMRERAAMLGGALYAGPTVEGGFEVAATLPLATEQVGDEQVGAGA